jgi:hypothetical protein
MANRQLQASLTLGPVNDPLEQEADRISDQVVSRIGGGREEQADNKPHSRSIASDHISRDAVAPAPTGAASPALEGAIDGARGGGQPLASTTRKPMEQAFGADFGGVKIHTDSRADTLNRAVQARAFTSGQDLFFRNGEFDPTSHSGQKLLAHELTHVMQQNPPQAIARSSGGEGGRVQRAATPVGSTIDWSTATQATPSGAGGKGGVMFMQVGGVMHVVKAVGGTAATAMFGEQMVSDISGAGTTDSLPVDATSAEGMALLTRLRHFQAQAQIGTNDDMKKRWAEKLPFFEGASYFLIQRAMDPTQEAGTVMSANPVSILGNAQRMFNAGKLLAADTLIGNADRWEQLNLGNLFLGANSSMLAIDTDALLQNRAAGIRLEDFGSDVSSWTGALISGHSELQEADAIGAAAPSSSLSRVFTDFDRWFDSTVKGLITNPTTWGRYNTGNIPDDFDWDGARANMKRGLDAGMQVVYAQLTGAQYQQVKTDFHDYETAYGGDINFDWQAFKAKALYAKMVYEGIDGVQAEENVTAYYEKYKDGFKSGEWDQQWVNIAHWDANLANVPARPPALDKKERAKRAFTVRGRSDKQDAKALKKFLRDQSNWNSAAINEKLPQLQAKAALDRRFSKALFEARYILYLVDQSNRKGELEGMKPGIDKLQADAKGGSPTAAKIANKLLLAPKAAIATNALRTIVLTNYKQVSSAYRQNYAVLEGQDNDIVSTDRSLNLDVRQAVDKLEASVKA